MSATPWLKANSVVHQLVADGADHDVRMVFEGKRLRAYVDGDLVAEANSDDDEGGS